MKPKSHIASPKQASPAVISQRISMRLASPVTGGWITDTLNWDWLFYVNLIPGFAVAALVVWLVKIDEPDLKLLKNADYPGIALMALALGALEYVLEEGARWNWFDDSTIRNCSYISGVSFILFLIRRPGSTSAMIVASSPA
jgi:DHA2 family multidrug resistance protein